MVDTDDDVDFEADEFGDEEDEDDLQESADLFTAKEVVKTAPKTSSVPSQPSVKAGQATKGPKAKDLGVSLENTKDGKSLLKKV